MAGLIAMGAIEKLPREDFHRLFVKNICQKAEFGHLVAAGAADLSDDEKAVLAEALAQFVPQKAVLANEDLDVIAFAVTARSVELR